MFRVRLAVRETVPGNCDSSRPDRVSPPAPLGQKVRSGFPVLRAEGVRWHVSEDVLPKVAEILHYRRSFESGHREVTFHGQEASWNMKPC